METQRQWSFMNCCVLELPRLSEFVCTWEMKIVKNDKKLPRKLSFPQFSQTEKVNQKMQFVNELSKYLQKQLLITAIDVIEVKLKK